MQFGSQQQCVGTAQLLGAKYFDAISRGSRVAGGQEFSRPG
jgi:hypothetical protein